MLAELRIENLAVIEGTEAHFAPGLNALTGESGAGKSVLLAALGLALGGRAEVGLVRRGQERARVAAAFSDPGAAVSQLSSDLGLGAEEALVLQREVAATGRSVSRANGALVAASALAQLGERLVELQGQGATSAWLRESQQRAGLDSLDRPQSLEDLELIQSGWGRRERLLRDLADLEQRRERMAAELELARLDLAELEAAQLQDGEDERLVRERELLRHSQGLRGAGDRLRLALAGDGELEGAAGLLGGALQDAGRQRGLDPALDRLLDEAERSASELQELRLAASAYLDQISEDPGRLEQVEERLELLDRLARRHGGTLGAAIARQDQARAIVELGEGGGPGRAQLEAELASLEAVLGKAMAQRSLGREEVAARLQEVITNDLRRMLMPTARFRIRVWQVEDPAGLRDGVGRTLAAGPEGWDRVSFELAANPGEPPRPLSEVASGGELARTALALCSQLSEALGVETVVFDEIDQGLGGESANRVGDLLREVATTRQVICVTHLAALAARADHHLVVAKEERQGRASSSVRAVRGEERIEELARLLAGEATPAAARAHAQELLLAVGSGSGGREHGDP